jgi:nucleoside-diphosphate-sugar epimerase
MGREHVIPQVTSGVLSAAATTPGGASAVPVRIQGTGKETRAFVFIDDFTAGLLLAMERGDHLGIYHVGTEQEITIASLVERIGHLLGVQVEVIPGEAPSGGTPRRCPDISRLRELGFEPQVSLTDGLTATVTWYEQQYRRENMRE